MAPLLIYGIVLLAAVLLSELAHRSILSTAVLFLAAGFIAGPGIADFIHLEKHDEMVGRFAELALFSVLFTDGMRVHFEKRFRSWDLPARALGLGLPLTMLGTAVMAHVIVDLSWVEAFLIGAVLSPTDPVLAAAIVGREEIPLRLRRLLNVESGLNDGLALPVVLAILASATGQNFKIPVALIQALMGVALGIAVAWIALALSRRGFLGASASYEPLYAFAIALIVLAASVVIGANEFLAAFAAGVTVANVGNKLPESFHGLIDPLSELFKLAGLLAFGALLSPAFFSVVPLSGYVLAVIVLAVIRPVALGVSLLGTSLSWRDRVVAVWFGPKGFASVFYGLLVMKSGMQHADALFHLIAIVITASIVAHSSTDVLIARWYEKSTGSGIRPSPQNESSVQFGAAPKRNN